MTQLSDKGAAPRINPRYWKAEKRKLVKRIAVDGEQFVSQNFKKEGFQDGTLKRWAPASPQSRKPKTQNLLVKSGVLRNDTRSRVIGEDRVQLINDAPYARRHNEGLDGMPKRQFMGKSKTLNKAIKKQIGKSLRKLF